MASTEAISTSPGPDDAASNQRRVLTEDAAIVDRSEIGRLAISGADTIDLLDRLSTNDLRGLTVGRGIGTVLTTNKGRVIDLLTVVQLDGRLLALTGPGNQSKVAEWMDFYTFTEDVSVMDITPDTAMMSVVGPKSGDIVEAVFGLDVRGWQRFDGAPCPTVDGCTIVRTDFAGVLAFDVIVHHSAESEVRDRLESNGVLSANAEALELLRIENMAPAFGAELTENHNPLEAGLLEYISFNKGCYIGQEVVARLNAYDKVQRHLVSLTWSGDATLPSGSTLSADGQSVGVVTSSSSDDASRSHVALALVRRSHSDTGTALAADVDGGAIEVVVARSSEDRD